MSFCDQAPRPVSAGWLSLGDTGSTQTSRDDTSLQGHWHLLCAHSGTPSGSGMSSGFHGQEGQDAQHCSKYQSRAERQLSCCLPCPILCTEKMPGRRGLLVYALLLDELSLPICQGWTTAGSLPSPSTQAAQPTATAEKGKGLVLSLQV